MTKSLAVQFAFVALLAAQQAKDDAWASLQFLVGEWAGAGNGQPGQGGGNCSFQPDLQRRILVRKSYAEYPATNQRPAFRHDDLMIVYPETGGLRAEYFDNEGHVIHYALRVAADSAEFLSDAAVGAPRYRLTYVKAGPDALSMKFEVAPPGKPDSFQTYLDAKLRRAGR